MADSKELIFQNTVIEKLVASGWRAGLCENYEVGSALYEENVLGYVQRATPEVWAKFCKQNPQDAILESRSAHEKQAMRVLTQKSTTKQFFNLLLDMLLRDLGSY